MKTAPTLWINKSRIDFDGTNLNLMTKLTAVGAKAGDVFKVNYKSNDEAKAIICSVVEDGTGRKWFTENNKKLTVRLQCPEETITHINSVVDFDAHVLTVRNQTTNELTMYPISRIVEVKIYG